ncbi:MAG: S-layer homology domain-containing protein, partial [Oscillospiraceae bacterium]|nr:S-layer homology domain-containing protein [Oscillospiraceae bacterium]
RTVGCPEPSIENPYSDVPAGRFFEKPAIWAYETGIFKGENGKFEPDAACTRADTVVFLYRYFTLQNLTD